MLWNQNFIAINFFCFFVMDNLFLLIRLRRWALINKVLSVFLTVNNFCFVAKSNFSYGLLPTKTNRKKLIELFCWKHRWIWKFNAYSKLLITWAPWCLFFLAVAFYNMSRLTLGRLYAYWYAFTDTSKFKTKSSEHTSSVKRIYKIYSKLPSPKMHKTWIKMVYRHSSDIRLYAHHFNSQAKSWVIKLLPLVA